jgi:hypothetical protein
MNNKYLERLEEDSTLIKELGAFASAFNPGISIDTPGEGRMQLDSASWNWLRPLLVELTNSRKNFQQMDLKRKGQ